MIPTKNIRSMISDLIRFDFSPKKYRDGYKHWRHVHLLAVDRSALRGVEDYILDKKVIEKRYSSRLWYRSEDLKPMKVKLKRGQKGIRITSTDGSETLLYNEDQLQRQFVSRRGRAKFPLIDKIERVLSHRGIEVFHSTIIPQFNYEQNVIFLPPTERFRSVGEYYKTLFHEVGHWSIFNLSDSLGFTYELSSSGKTEEQQYNFEEMIVEMFSVMMADRYELEYDRDSTLSYIHMYCDPKNPRAEILNYAYRCAKEIYVKFFARETFRYSIENEY